MTPREREEEITQQAHKYILSDTVKNGNEYLAFGDFINGAKWTDEHPSQELKRQIVNKAVEWLKSLDFEIYNEQKQGLYIWYTIFNKDKFIESFKRAMEE